MFSLLLLVTAALTIFLFRVAVATFVCSALSAAPSLVIHCGSSRFMVPTLAAAMYHQAPAARLPAQLNQAAHHLRVRRQTAQAVNRLAVRQVQKAHQARPNQALQRLTA